MVKDDWLSMDKWLRNYNPNDTLLHGTWQFYDGAKWKKDKYLKAIVLDTTRK